MLGVVAFNFNSISGAPIRENDVSVRVLTPSVTCDISGGYGQGLVNVEFMIDAPSGVTFDSKVIVREIPGGRRVTTADLSSKSRIGSGEYSFSTPCDPEDVSGALSICVRNPSTGEIKCSENTFNINYI